TLVPSVASMTSIAVFLRNNSGSMLVWPGCWWVTTTNAIPVSAGMLSNSSSRASNPPADAPIPAIGKLASGGLLADASCCFLVLPDGDSVTLLVAALDRADFEAPLIGFVRFVRFRGAIEHLLHSIFRSGFFGIRIGTGLAPWHWASCGILP